MINMILYFFLLLLLLFILLMLNFMFSKKTFKKKEMMSPFECGFDPMSSNRLPFSLQFYLITIIFLIFDIEIVLLIPMIYNFNMYYYMIHYYEIFIIMILLLGLFLEMKEGALMWFK